MPPTKPTKARQRARDRRQENARSRQLAAARQDEARAARQARLTVGSAGPLFLSRDDLRDYYGVNYSRSHLHRLIAAGEFPAPVALGPHPSSRKAWRRSDVEAWVERLQPATYTAA